MFIIALITISRRKKQIANIFIRQDYKFETNKQKEKKKTKQNKNQKFFSQNKKCPYLFDYDFPYI